MDNMAKPSKQPPTDVTIRVTGHSLGGAMHGCNSRPPNRCCRAHTASLPALALAHTPAREATAEMSAVLSAFCPAGAIATICALRLAMLGWKVELVTFGSPRVGNASFSSLVKKLVPNNARFVNPGDLVPSWPPLAFKFSHVDKKYRLGQQNESGSQKDQPGSQKDEPGSQKDESGSQKNESVSDTEDDAESYTPEKGTWCGLGCIPKAKPPGKKGHGTASYVTNLLVPMNITDFPPGFTMTKPGEIPPIKEKPEDLVCLLKEKPRPAKTHVLTIGKNILDPLKAPSNEEMKDADRMPKMTSMDTVAQRTGRQLNVAAVVNAPMLSIRAAKSAKPAAKYEHKVAPA